MHASYSMWLAAGGRQRLKVAAAAALAAIAQGTGLINLLSKG